MALLNADSLQKIEKTRNTVHNEVDATYTSFTDSNGEDYVQIDIYSSAERKRQGKISHSIQLDKDSAISLMQLLKKELKINKISKLG